MKYFGYVISLFLVLFLISEIAYAVSGEWLSTENEEESPIASYEERLDRSVPRLKGNAVLIWVLEDTEQETEEEKIREWMNLKPADYAGLDQSGFEQMLDERQPAPEMAELGLTEFEIRSFTGYEAVIAVKRRETETSRFGYWCQLQEDRIRVLSTDSEALVLEQKYKPGSLTAGTLRRLKQGCYLETYEQLIHVLE